MDPSAYVPIYWIENEPGVPANTVVAKSSVKVDASSSSGVYAERSKDAKATNSTPALAPLPTRISEAVEPVHAGVPSSTTVDCTGLMGVAKAAPATSKHTADIYTDFFIFLLLEFFFFKTRAAVAARSQFLFA
jgi:hypothetical protein